MKELEKEFVGVGEVKGFLFRQIMQSETAYLYEVNDEGSFHYEVFKRVEKQASQAMRDNVLINFSAKVSYPSAKSFGTTAWTYRNLDTAIEKFKTL